VITADQVIAESVGDVPFSETIRIATPSPAATAAVPVASCALVVDPDGKPSVFRRLSVVRRASHSESREL
jgi:hypothetical protein